jgi:hypothetical protein
MRMPQRLQNLTAVAAHYCTLQEAHVDSSAAARRLKGFRKKNRALVATRKGVKSVIKPEPRPRNGYAVSALPTTAHSGPLLAARRAYLEHTKRAKARS